MEDAPKTSDLAYAAKLENRIRENVREISRLEEEIGRCKSLISKNSIENVALAAAIRVLIGRDYIG